MKLIIAGAGIGGLVGAIALRRLGFEVEIHEAAAHLREAGAGLTLSRSAQHVFRALDLQDRVAALASRSAAFPFVHFRTGRLLAGAHDHGAGMPDDGIADVGRQIHRADLQQVLVAAFNQSGAPATLDHRIAGFAAAGARVAVRFANGDEVVGDALIGADGVRSAVRAALWGEDTPRFTGQVAYRFLVPIAAARPFMSAGRGAVFLGPGRTFNRYTVRAGALVNCVGILATSEWAGEGWSTPATVEEMLAAFEGWHPDIQGLIRCATSAIKWGIFDRAPLPQWSKANVTLLGDAAHAMLPFLGMGAAMAIEDGMIIARAFASERTIEGALERYELARRPRTALLHSKSVEQGRLTQAQDPDDYDGSAAPAGDAAIAAYDPVTAEI